MITLNVAVLGNDVLLPALRKGDLDIALTHTRPFPRLNLTQELFREDEFVVYGASSHRLAKRKSVLLDDLAQERWAIPGAGAFGSLLSRCGAFEERGVSAPRHYARLGLGGAQASRGSPLRSDRRHRQGARPRSRDPTSPENTPRRGSRLGSTRRCFYRKDAYLSPVARRFIEILETTARGIRRPPAR